MNVLQLIQLLMTLGPAALEIIKRILPLIKELIDLFKEKNPSFAMATAVEATSDDQWNEAHDKLVAAGATPEEAEDIVDTCCAFGAIAAGGAV